MMTGDVGGCDKIVPLWRFYFPNTHFIIFVVDSKDSERIVGKGNLWTLADQGVFNDPSRPNLQIAHEALHTFMKEPELRGLPVLIFANKQVGSGALCSEQLLRGLHLNAFLH
jgi:hypothetical protein